jgi:uncharacterized protein YxjI
MIVEFKRKGLDSYTVVDKESKKKIYSINKRSLMGSRYVVVSGTKNVAEIKKSPYDLKRANITIGKESMGYISCDWTNRLDVKLVCGWYISTEGDKSGYQIRSYGNRVAKVICKYGLGVKYSVEVDNLESLLCICAVVLALDIIDYNEEKF